MPGASWNRYDKKNLLRIGVAFNRKTEPQLVKKIEEIQTSGKSVSAYIKGLVQKDVDAERTKE